MKIVKKWACTEEWALGLILQEKMCSEATLLLDHSNILEEMRGYDRLLVY